MTDKDRVLLAKAIAIPDRVNKLSDAEYSVFSQWGDDGIIQYLTHHLKLSNNFFVEFGVENYHESNTRFLLMNNNWSGLVMDASKKNVEFIQSADYFWKYDLLALHSFV